MAASTCLASLATAVGDQIVQPVVPFIEANIRASNWHQREAAVMAFGSILDGPTGESIMPLVQQAMPILIEMLKDPDVHVKDTTAWTLGRICELTSDAIQPDALQPLVTGLAESLNDQPRIVTNSCWALMNLADHMQERNGGEDLQTSPMSPFYQGIVQELLKVTET